MILLRAQLWILFLAVVVYASYGHTDLRIVNSLVSPDGFNRS